jgi:Tfp pilus assembly protein PilF
LTTKALQEHTTNQGLLTLNAALARQKELEGQRKRLLELADRDLAVGNYDAAGKWLNEVAEIDPSNHKAETLRWELAKARGLEQRRAFLDDLQQRIRVLSKNDAYEQALHW